MSGIFKTENCASIYWLTRLFIVCKKKRGRQHLYFLTTLLINFVIITDITR
jgi:hypothetical protein